MKVKKRSKKIVKQRSKISVCGILIALGITCTACILFSDTLQKEAKEDLINLESSITGCNYTLEMEAIEKVGTLQHDLDETHDQVNGLRSASLQEQLKFASVSAEMEKYKEELESKNAELEKVQSDNTLLKERLEEVESMIKKVEGIMEN